MTRLIDADALKEQIIKQYENRTIQENGGVIGLIDNAPTIEADGGESEPVMAIRLAVNEILDCGEKLPPKTREWIYFIKNLTGELLTQEPIAEVTKHGIFGIDRSRVFKVGTKLYTSPPKREWVELTDEQIRIVGANMYGFAISSDYVEFARNIENEIKEVNHG